MNYEFPEELEFFERGFGYSSEYDHDEAQFSFLMDYDTGERLIFAHSPFGNNSVNVKLFQSTELVFHIYKEEVTNIAFQNWGGELVLRVYFANDLNNFLVYFNPKPRLKYCEPNM
ncbi:hypothetical protein [Pseudoalteromonas luteoviolacea]|uniref:hypothetical protein n=1 Tax=Pseudoalteromonas luteoviolacea TaxID=43657 RepID=UPI001B370F12|nr:hypothetical protein [Pseudoalteromonas luteoviolacea]MBQ4836843.1 hypothetical protein [Pseudoalteromonas luteoviolacea]